MRVGYGKKILDVETPSSLAGYNKDRVSQQYNDNLEMHCLTLEYDGQLFHFVSADILGIDQNIVTDVQYMYPDDVLLIAATHTHSGPGGLWMPNHAILKDYGNVVKEFDAYQTYLLKDELVQVIRLAIDDLHDLKSTSVLETEVEDVATNRNDKTRKGDNRLIAYQFKTERKQYLWVTFANHPTVLNDSYEMLHPDFVGPFRDALDQYDGVVYFNGAAGDISTRFTRVESSIEETKRMGELLASNIVEASFDNIENLSISHKKEIYEVQLKDDRLFNLKLDKLQMNDVRFVGFPLELNSELIQDYKDTYFISYLNDYLMYGAQIESYRNQEYEASMSPFKEGEMERILKEAM